MILDAMDSIFSQQEYLRCLYKAMLLMGYYAMLRVGEMASGDYPIDVNDVKLAVNKKRLSVTIRIAKNMLPGQPPHVVRIPSLTQQQEYSLYNDFGRFGQEHYTGYDPWLVIREYIAVRPGRIVGKPEPFFVFADRSLVRPHHFTTALRQTISHCHLNAQLYGPHSLKIGRASDMGRLNLTLERIKREGRWSSSNTVARYVRHVH